MDRVGQFWTNLDSFEPYNSVLNHLKQINYFRQLKTNLDNFLPTFDHFEIFDSYGPI